MQPIPTDLLIRIGARPGPDRPYPVEAVIDSGGLFFGGELRLDIAELVAASLGVGVYGATLAKALFSEPIRRAYERARSMADERGGGRLRLRIQIDPDASELQALRWERLAVDGDSAAVPVAINQATPFSRYVGLESAPPPPLSEQPVRLLIAVANPADLGQWNLAPVETDTEIDSLWQALAPLLDQRALSLGVLPGRGGLSASLRERLAAQGCRIHPGASSLENLSALIGDHHLIHLIAHGAFKAGGDGAPGATRLFLEDEAGAADLVGDEALVQRWSAARPPPRLVFLQACEGASRGGEDSQPFVGLAPRLVSAGVPAVVAMQDKVPMGLARDLSRGFYTGLLRHGLVDQALNEARWLLFDAGSTDWSIPVLYMRLEQGRLLRPDPLREALRAMAEWGEDPQATDDPPLPMQVTRAPGGADPSVLSRLERVEEAGYDLGPTAAELLLAKDPADEAGAPFVLLLGREGTGKTVHLRRLLGRLAREALQVPDAPARLPVLVDLAATHDLDLGGRGIEDLVRESLTRFWPDLDPREFLHRWRDDQKSAFCVLVDNPTALSAGERARLFADLARVARRGGHRHRFLLACDPNCAHQGALSEILPITDYLVVRRLGFTQVEAYLSGLDDPAAAQLAASLRERRLFDLAGLPWLLLHMLSRSRLGEPPVSRTAVLQGFVNRAIADGTLDGALRGRARASLGTLARELQLARCRSISLERALELLDGVRGRREYRLTDMIEALVDARILMRVGQERLQFAYPALQSYCCAEAIAMDPGWRLLVDDITAALGRLSRLRWWADTLVLLAGLIDRQSDLLELILHGAGAGQEERVFLGARCVEEGGTERLDSLLHEQLVAALIHLTSADHEPRTRVRIRAIRAIQRLQVEDSVPHLVRVAIEPVRTDWTGRQVAEYSSVRLAAITSLRAMEQATFRYVKTDLPEFSTLLRHWINGRAADVEDYLGASDRRMRPVAAFLLGLLPGGDAHDRLIAQFLSPIHEPEVTWALTDALTLVDPARVSHAVLAPLVARGGSDKRQRRQIAYLIGKVKPREPWADTFLDRAVFGLTDASLKGHALRAWGDRLRGDRKDLLIAIALGDFSSIAMGKGWRAADRTWLRRVAIETLSILGDTDTARRLRQERVPGQDWPPELELALFRTGEEIAWRAWENEEGERLQVSDDN